MSEVFPGIYQIKLPLPGMASLLGYVNSYLVKGDRGHLLVDTGLNTAGAYNALQTQFAEAGAAVKEITQIVITHIHPDHYGLVGRLKQIAPARFYLHRMERDLIDSRYIHMEDLLQKMARWLDINGVPPAEMPDMQTASVGLARFVSHVLPDVLLDGGETISAGAFNFRVIWTPGHSPGHICLYEPDKKVLLGGDEILPTITPNIGLHPQSGGNPLGDFLRSLKALAEMDIELVLPGHETPFRDVKTRVAQIVQHHAARFAEIVTAMKGGVRTGYQIARKLTWHADMGGIGWQGLSLWDKRLAVLETLAHLESMKADGRVEKYSENNFVYYRLVER